MSQGVFAHWPNRITALRFFGALVLFLVFSILHRTEAWSAKDPVPGELGWGVAVCFWLFVVVAATDAVDGYLARRDNLITAFGRVADPFVDKVLIVGAMIYLAVIDWSAPWFPPGVVVVVLAREFLVTGLRGYVESQGMPFPADWFGKIKMILQCIAIGTVLALHGYPWGEALAQFLSLAGHVFVWATVITSVGSGVTYVLRTRKLLLHGVS